jgi:hypothetical protein
VLLTTRRSRRSRAPRRRISSFVLRKNPCRSPVLDEALLLAAEELLGSVEPDGVALHQHGEARRVLPQRTAPGNFSLPDLGERGGTMRQHPRPRLLRSQQSAVGTAREMWDSLAMA